MHKILYMSSEAFPLVKTGGLADVAGSLPIALLKQSQDVHLFIPAYPEALQKISKKKVIAKSHYYDLPVQLIESRLPGSHVVLWLLDCPPLFNRPGGPYADEHGLAWHDNALRFAIFCHVAVDIALDKLSLNWLPDIIHCNDWQSGLVPALLSLHKQRPATVFTIHNLAYQGNFDHQAYNDLHLPSELWHMDGLEFYGQFSFIKGGLAYADKINAVSPTYAEEILSPDYSYGMDGLLHHRKQHLSGILNGIDEKQWNPGTDEHIYEKYNRRTLDKKSLNKTAMQKALNLEIDGSIPMLGMISRLVNQKGFDFILDCFDSLVQKKLQLVLLGTGETYYEEQLSEWAQKYPDKIHITIGYNEQLAHRIEAASDIYLMPSTFEPCGLNQLYSLRYGTLPLVTPVGGLADTVIDTNQKTIQNQTANGFIMKSKSAQALLEALDKALEYYQDKNRWKQLQINAMNIDASWQVSAEHYIDLYQQAKDQLKISKS